MIINDIIDMTTPSVPSTPSNLIRRLTGGAFRRSPTSSYREHSKPTIFLSSLYQVKQLYIIVLLLVGAVWLRLVTKSSKGVSPAVIINSSMTMQDKAAIKSESSTSYLRGDSTVGAPPEPAVSALNLEGSEQQQQTVTSDAAAATTSNPFDKEYDN